MDKQTEIILQLVDTELQMEVNTYDTEAERIESEFKYEAAKKMVERLRYKADIIDFTRRMVMIRLREKLNGDGRTEV